jgi:dTDP-4-amino-4,6-dideoxygalactose transaminase
VLKPPRTSIWPTLPPDAYVRGPRDSLPFPLEDPGHRVFSRARHGLFHGVRALGLSPGDGVLVPAYHHGSEVEALERAGLRCRFYEVAADLEPAEDRLEALLDPRVRAMYLIHYFGFPQDAGRWRAWCDRRNLVLIEDAAMSLLSTTRGRPVGSFGDLALFCLYKSFALPDGGAVVCTAPMPYPRNGRSIGLRQALMRNGSWLAQRSSASATLHALVGGDRQTPWGRDFDLGDPDARASRLTASLVPRIVDPGAADLRRSNYRVLFDALGDRLNTVFPTVPEGAVPISFLFRMEPEVQARLGNQLADRGVLLANFWMAPHRLVPTTGFEQATALRAEVVGLPVHQELRGVDLERIVDAMRSVRLTG